MLTPEMFALTITGAVAKHLLAKWLGDKWYTQVSQDLVDLLRDHFGDKAGRSAGMREVDQIAAKIAADADGWIQRELPALEAAERSEAVTAASEALARTRLSAGQMIEMRLDPARLNRVIQRHKPQAARHLSTAGAALYDRIILDTSQGIVRHAAQLPGFDVAVAAATMTELDTILHALLEPQAKHAQAVKEFERRYLEGVIHRLNRLELFGLRRIDQISEQQQLTIAYTNISCDVADANVDDIRGICNSERAWSALHYAWLDASNEPQQYSPDLFRRRQPKGQLKDVQKSSLVFLATCGKSLDQSWQPLLWKVLSEVPVKVRLMIRGKAGSGKSTLLQWLAISTARANLEKQDRIADPAPDKLSNAPYGDKFPFFIRLREYTSKGFPPPEDFVRATTPLIAGNMPSGWVHQILENGRALVLIDGLDEVSQTDRSGMLSSLQELVNTYPSSSYIVTSRPAAIAEDRWPQWTKWTKQAEFLHVVLKDMAPKQVEELIEHWHDALLESVSDPDEFARIERLPGQLKRQLATRSELRRLTVNPLLCAMICAVHHERRQDLPRERARLYQECVEMLLNRRDPGRGVSQIDYPPLTESQKWSVAQSVAYWFLRNGYTSAPVSEVERHITSLLGMLQCPGATAEGVRRFLVERTDLMREPAAGQVDFTHRTFLEYLAALAAVEMGDFGLLLKNAQDDLWRETIILAVGQARPYEAAQLLKDLLSKADTAGTDEERKRLCLLAAACLETPVLLDSQVRSLVLERTAELLPPTNDDEVSQIAKVGEPIVPLLGPNREFSGEDAARCIAILAQIGSRAALDVLTQYASDRRPEVVVALSAAWESFDRQEYLTRVLAHVAALTVATLPSAAELSLLTNLVQINIRELSPNNVSPLKELAHLKRIEVMCGAPISLKSFSGLTGVSELSLVTFGEITDLDALIGMQNLRFLELSTPGGMLLAAATTREGMDISIIARLKTLEELIFSDPVKNLQVVAELENLRSLTVPCSEFVTMGLPAQMRELSALYLHSIESPEFDVQVLLPMPRLKELGLDSMFGRSAEIRNLHMLDAIEGLTMRSVRFDVKELRGIQSLTSLSIDGGWVANLAALPELTQLRELRIVRGDFDFRLRDLAPLAVLQFLNIRGLLSTDLSGLAGMAHLSTLVVDARQAQDLSFLRSLPALRRLEVWSSGKIDWQSIDAIDGLEVTRV